VITFGTSLGCKEFDRFTTDQGGSLAAYVTPGDYPKNFSKQFSSRSEAPKLRQVLRLLPLVITALTALSRKP